MTQQVTIKQALDWLAENGMFYIVFDTQVEGVDIPAHLKKVGHCMLKFSYAFSPNGKADLEIFDSGIQQTLSFDGNDYLCFVPADAFLEIGAANSVSEPPWLETPPERTDKPIMTSPFTVIDGGKK